jgi:hypothetical protein
MHLSKEANIQSSMLGIREKDEQKERPKHQGLKEGPSRKEFVRFFVRTTPA